MVAIVRAGAPVNHEKWDQIGRDFASGRMVPANGMTQWNEIAAAEAARVAFLLGGGTETIIEVGSGVGRLTRSFVNLFRHVTATDTSPVMRGITRAACQYAENLDVMAPGLPDADAAVIWGHLYDEDWLTSTALVHIQLHVETYRMVLLQTNRPDLVNGLAHLTAARGEDWLLLRGSLPEKG